MGRNNPKYKKDLHQQAYEVLTGMIAFGQSKRVDKLKGTDRGKIYSFSTYQTYKKHIGYFLQYIRTHHPECSTLKSAKKYVNEWLQKRVNFVDKRGNHLSAWTIQTEAAALNKLYQIDKADIGRFQPPARRRTDIVRSRVDVARDKCFSITNNDELIKFCKGTGVRRGVLQKLEGRDLWTRSQMEAKLSKLEAEPKPTEKEKAQLTTLKQALRTFPDQDYFVHHRKDKGGKYRYAPIIGKNKAQIIERFEKTAPGEKVFRHVPTKADIHAYRSDYARDLYKMYARPMEDIPFDRYNKGMGIWKKSEVYYCKGDLKGVRYDRTALKKSSIAIGHSRETVIASSYLRGL